MRKQPGLQCKPRRRKETDANVYYITGRYLGVKVNVSLGTEDEREANRLFDEKLPDVLRRIRDGHYASDTFGKLAQDYKAKGKSDRFLQPLIDKFGHTKTNDIPDADVLKFLDEYGAKHGWSPQTKNRQGLTPFMAVCNWGARQRPQRCHARLIEPYEFDKEAVIAAPDAWLFAVLDACEAQRHHKMRALILLLCITAARISEALRIEWHHIHLEEGWALLERTKSKKGKPRPRRLTLPQVLVDALREIKPDVSDADLIGRRVFSWSHRSGVAVRLKAICRRAGLSYYSSHKWGRHKFAEHMLRSKMPLSAVKDGGGWASLTVVVDNYGYMEESYTSELVRANADRLASRIDNHRRLDATTDTTRPKMLEDKRKKA